MEIPDDTKPPFLFPDNRRYDAQLIITIRIFQYPFVCPDDSVLLLCADALGQVFSA